MNKLFEVVKSDPIELAVLPAAFYGLRRSEVEGLKRVAIDLKNKTIIIQHTVIETSMEGNLLSYFRREGPYQKQIKSSLPAYDRSIRRVSFEAKGTR